MRDGAFDLPEGDSSWRWRDNTVRSALPSIATRERILLAVKTWHHGGSIPVSVVRRRCRCHVLMRDAGHGVLFVSRLVLVPRWQLPFELGSAKV